MPQIGIIFIVLNMFKMFTSDNAAMFKATNTALKNFTHLIVCKNNVDDDEANDNSQKRCNAQN